MQETESRKDKETERHIQTQIQRWTQRQGDRGVGLKRETEETEMGREKQNNEKQERCKSGKGYRNSKMQGTGQAHICNTRYSGG